jgi:hypothetical protein
LGQWWWVAAAVAVAAAVVVVEVASLVELASLGLAPPQQHPLAVPLCL